jgi:hypothetical protein
LLLESLDAFYFHYCWPHIDSFSIHNAMQRIEQRLEWRQMPSATTCSSVPAASALTCHLRLRNSCCLIIFLEGFTIQYTFNIHSIYIQYTLGLSSFFFTESRWVLRLSWNYNTTIFFFPSPASCTKTQTTPQALFKHHRTCTSDVSWSWWDEPLEFPKDWRLCTRCLDTKITWNARDRSWRIWHWKQSQLRHPSCLTTCWSARLYRHSLCPCETHKGWALVLGLASG